MKKAFRLSLLISITASQLIMSACNAISPYKEDSESLAATTSIYDCINVEASDYNAEYYKLTVDDIIIKNDVKIGDVFIKSEYNVSEPIKKEPSATKKPLLNSSETTSAKYIRTNAPNDRRISASMSFYIDEYEYAQYHYYFRNDNGDYLGFYNSDSNFQGYEITNESEFEELALAAIYNFTDASQYSKKIADIERYEADGNKPYTYRYVYTKLLNDIETTEYVICVVRADRVIEYCMTSNPRMFENVAAPKIDMKQLEALAFKKAGFWFDELTQNCEITDIEIKDCIYDIYNGNLELHFKLAYHYYNRNVEQMKDHPLYDSIRMVIVFD